MDHSLEMFSNRLSNSKAILINLDRRAQQTKELVTAEERRGCRSYCWKGNGIFVEGRVGVLMNFDLWGNLTCAFLLDCTVAFSTHQMSGPDDTVE